MLERLTAGQYFGRLAHRDVAGFGLAESVYTPGTCLRPHAHERDHFTLVVAGAYEERLAGRPQQRKTADVLFLPRDVVHEERHDANGRHFMIDVAPAHSARLPRRALEGARALQSEEARRIMGRLRREFLRRDGPSALVVEGLALLLLAQLETSGMRERDKMPTVVRRAEDFIRASLVHAVALSDVARAVGVEGWRLAAAFRQLKGCSVGEFVRRVQVEYVCERLRSSDDSITTIAHAAGYSDHSHCSRAFKEALGVSPREYRRGGRCQA